MTKGHDWVYQIPGIAEACRPDGPLLTYREVFDEEAVVTPSRVFTWLAAAYLAVVCPVVEAWHRLVHRREWREYREMMDRWLGEREK